MHRPAGVIPRPCLHLAPVPAAPLVGQEAQVSMPRGRELPVGLRTGEGGGQSWGHPRESGWMFPEPNPEKGVRDPRLRLSGLQCLHLSAGKEGKVRARGSVLRMEPAPSPCHLQASCLGEISLAGPRKGWPTLWLGLQRQGAAAIGPSPCLFQAWQSELQPLQSFPTHYFFTGPRTSPAGRDSRSPFVPPQEASLLQLQPPSPLTMAAGPCRSGKKGASLPGAGGRVAGPGHTAARSQI